LLGGTNQVDESIEEAFRFLVDGHGFTRVIDGDGTAYACAAVTVKPSFSERDGFDTRLVFPQNGPQEISVGTILASMDTVQSANNASWTHTMRREVLFIRQNRQKLLDLPDEIHRDCCALRFWHAIEWRERWGTSIVMSAQSIVDERARLRRIQGYFENVPSAA
jgi:hypothetical protein